MFFNSGDTEVSERITEGLGAKLNDWDYERHDEGGGGAERQGGQGRCIFLSRLYGKRIADPFELNWSSIVLSNRSTIVRTELEFNCSFSCN